MKYNDEKNTIKALKNGNPAALRGVILEGCQNLYVYAAAVCREYHREMVLMTEIYVRMWETRDLLDQEESLDMALKKIMWEIVYVQYNNGQFRYCVDTTEHSIHGRDGYEQFVLSDWIIGLKPFDKKVLMPPVHGWRCPPDFKMALVMNVMRRISA